MTRFEELQKAMQDDLAQYKTPEEQKKYWKLEEAKRIYEENFGSRKTFNPEPPKATWSDKNEPSK